MLTIILQTSATSQSWWHYADNNGHYLKDILSSSDRDAIGNGFAETYNPYKVEDSALHFHIPFLVNYTPALPNFGQKRFWNRVPRFPINGTPCSTLKQIYVFLQSEIWKAISFQESSAVMIWNVLNVCVFRRFEVLVVHNSFDWMLTKSDAEWRNRYLLKTQRAAGEDGKSW